MNRAKFYTSVVLTAFLLFGLTVPAHALTTLTSSLLLTEPEHVYIDDAAS